MQQPADFFCKETQPVRPRLEAPSIRSRSPTQRHDVENVASAGVSPVASTSFKESKPQQTGTRLLPGYGEVATTSGFTNFTASWCNSSIPGFDPDGLGANPSEAANVSKSSFDRSVVK